MQQGSQAGGDARGYVRCPALVRQRHADNAASLVASLVAGFLVLQVLIGALLVWLKLPAGLVAAHISLAEAVWGGLVVLTVLAFTESVAGGEPGRPKAEQPPYRVD